ncbi:EGF-like repeat and discoidin I-like domain-containing protein 3 isoform X3 [Polypterus senegalus]|uniref:EGF-like repeat and discoidin I-like domain-containing protein 3 isoform X3 n=1 Tax=Polypterus senegalus TaxID=55291 RepID=UPI001963314A|nr:EGF-like repeat and discoidin I-like domain-containing protein 3 isoform X3 [Polypterus senegalus]
MDRFSPVLNNRDQDERLVASLVPSPPDSVLRICSTTPGLSGRQRQIALRVSNWMKTRGQTGTLGATNLFCLPVAAGGSSRTKQSQARRARVPDMKGRWLPSPHILLFFAGIIFCLSSAEGPCNPNPCHNNGECEEMSGPRRGDVFSEYICRCQDGYTGVHCQNNVNECLTQPCKNGGMCQDLDGEYSCKCPSPFMGKQCQMRCVSSLGMEGGVISESQITASSVHYGFLGLQRWGPDLARLNNKGIVNAWTSATHDKSPWIQVDFQRKMRITGIITQGASRIGTAEFIKNFKVASSFDGKTFTMYRAEGQNKDTVFIANVDNDGSKTNLFDPPIIAQYIRIIPTVCRKACTLRMELIGCELNVYLNTAGCSDPLGMKSRLITDTQITGSSAYRTWGIDAFTWLPHLARLDMQGKTNAWTALHNNRTEWIQVDFETSKQITGIITQGAKDFGTVQFVSAFKVAYSNDGESWSIIKDTSNMEDKIYQGNVDNNTHKKNLFDPPIIARFVRIIPWTWHNKITLRMELLGCDE